MVEGAAFPRLGGEMLDGRTFLPDGRGDASLNAGANAAWSQKDAQVGSRRDAPHEISSGCELSNLVKAAKSSSGLALLHISFRNAISTDLPPCDDLYGLRLTLAGSMRTTLNGLTVEAVAGDFTVTNPGSVDRQQWGPWSQHLLLFLPVCEVERAVGAEIGDHSRRKVIFERAATSAEAAPTLFNYVRLLSEDLSSCRTLSRPTAARLSLEMMSSLMLRLLPNDKQRQIESSKSPAAPYYVRRAIDYADVRFGDAISLRDMAGAAGVCSRTLDKGFRRFCDKSPMEHLRAVRLEKARSYLMGARDPLTTVSSTARLCGFRHLGRFAEYYARQFGELPSQTLIREQQAG